MALALDLKALQSRLSREGAQSGAITVSLIWNDPSDLDLHAHVKRNGAGNKVDHIFYGHKRAAGGYLDVDMNVRESGKGFSLEPVENIFWKSPPGGEYKIFVTNAGTKSSPTKWDGKYADNTRSIPFKVFLNRDGEMQEYEGQWSPGTGQIDAFAFEVEGDGSVADTGGGGNYLVFPPEDDKSTFKDLCAKHEVPWRIGGGFYAVARKEKIQAGKEMLLQHLASNNFTIGGQKCRDALGWPAGEVNKGPKDILEGHRLFVQSTSANRVIQPGTHVLFEVDDVVYAAHQKTSTIAEDEHKKTGTADAPPSPAKAKAATPPPSPAKAKAATPPPSPAKAKAKGEAKARAAADAPEEEELRTEPEGISEADQHAFLDLAKEYKWDAVKRKVSERPLIVFARPCQRWSALHQAAASGDEEIVKFLLDHRAPTDATTKDGQKPLDVAEGAKIKAMLREAGKRKAEAEPKGRAKAKAKAK